MFCYTFQVCYKNSVHFYVHLKGINAFHLRFSILPWVCLFGNTGMVYFLSLGKHQFYVWRMRSSPPQGRLSGSRRCLSLLLPWMINNSSPLPKSNWRPPHPALCDSWLGPLHCSVYHLKQSPAMTNQGNFPFLIAGDADTAAFWIIFFDTILINVYIAVSKFAFAIPYLVCLHDGPVRE